MACVSSYLAMHVQVLECYHCHRLFVHPSARAPGRRDVRSPPLCVSSHDFEVREKPNSYIYVVNLCHVAYSHPIYIIHT